MPSEVQAFQFVCGWGGINFFLVLFMISGSFDVAHSVAEGETRPSNEGESIITGPGCQGFSFYLYCIVFIVFFG